jgi:KaiC/GvpD/RAD55 family RecA-like ATPase
MIDFEEGDYTGLILDQIERSLGHGSTKATPAAAKATPADGKPPPGEPLPLLMFQDIKPVLTAADFVQGTLVRGSSAVVYGDSNAGKTFFVTDLALHVAAAMRWNGRRVDGGAVIYAVLEGGNGFQNRVVAWGKQHSAPSSLPFAAIPASINLLDPDCDVPRFIAAIKRAAEAMRLPVALVVVDTLSRAMAGANENASDDMGALVRSMDTIRQSTGACLLFVHHSGKDAAKGARGHSLLRAAIDTEIEVKVDETTGNRTATVVKQRDLSKGSSFGFRLETMTLGSNEHGEPVTTCIVVNSDASPIQDSVLTAADKGWLRDLTDMFAEKASAMSRSHSSTIGHAQDATLTLTRDEVRAGFREKGRFDTENPDAALTGKDRERMRAALTRLKDRGKIGMTSSLVWLIHPRQAASDVRQN